MKYLMPISILVCLAVGSLAENVCIKTHTGGCRNHKKIHIRTVLNVDSVASCLKECRGVDCAGFSVSPPKKVCILYSGYCEKDGNPNWEFYLEESCKGDLEIGISLKEYQKQVDIFKKDIGDQHRAIEKLTEELRSQDALLDNQRSLIQGLKGDLAEEMQHREASDSAITGNADAIRNVNGRFDTLENTVVRNCSQDSDCAEPLHFCLHGWCSVVECTTDSHCTSSSKPKCYNNICACSSDLDCERSNEYCDTDDHSCTTFSGYNFEQFGFCTGDSGDFTGVSYDTLDDATNHCSGSCGCIVDGHCDGGTYYLRTGNYTNDASNWSIPPCAWVKT